MLILDEESVQESIPDKSVSRRTVIGIKFRKLVEQNATVGVEFPPYSFVILDSVDSEEPAINVISACGSEPVAEASQLSNWNQSFHYPPVIRSAMINCTQKV